ncbi:MAG: zf-HC2 domain-containing protein, partial [Gemmatimonadota bacterium]
MLHLDEGLVHELLDGELDPAQEAGVRAHIQECAECRRLYDDAREMLAEADRVIASLDDSVPVQPVVANDPGAPAPLIRPDFRPDATGVPVVLIPTNEEVTRPPPRRRNWTPLAMAAGVILALGAGYALFPRDGAMPAPRGGFVTLGSAPPDSSGTAAALTDSATPALATARTRQTDASGNTASDAARAAAPPATPAPRSLAQRDIPATERPVEAKAQSAPATAAPTTAAAKANALRFPDPPSDAASAPGTVASNAPSRADRGRFTAAPSAAAAEAGNTPAGPPLETQAQI